MRDLESVAARAAAVAAKEAATLAAREAVRELTAARPGDPTHSAASPVRVTGEGSDSQDPGHDRGAPDVTCLGSQRDSRGAEGFSADSRGAEGFSAVMGRVTHVDAAQHAAHQARIAGGSVAEQIVRAGTVGGGRSSSPTGPHAGYGEPWHAGSGGVALPIWNAEEALRRDKEASSLRSAAHAQQEGANRCGVGPVRSTASQLALLGLTDAQLAGLQATFGLSEAQLRGVQTDATLLDPRAAEPVPHDEPSIPSTGHAIREQGREWRSGSHVRFSSPSQPPGNSGQWYSGSTPDEADIGRGSSAQNGDQWHRGNSSGAAGFGRGSSAQSGDQWFSSSSSSGEAGFGRGNSAQSGDQWFSSSSTSGEAGFGRGSSAPSGDQWFSSSSSSGEAGFGRGSSAQSGDQWFSSSSSSGEADVGRGSSAPSGDQRFSSSSSPGEAGFGRGSSAPSGDQWFSSSSSPGAAGFGRGSSAPSGDQRFSSSSSPGAAGFGRGSSAPSGDQWFSSSSSPGAAGFGHSSAPSGDQWFSSSSLSGEADVGRGSSVRGGGNYGNGRSELSTGGPRVLRSAAEPTLAEQAQSNATTAHIESKMGSVSDPKYDKDANLHHPMHALSRAAVFGGGNLASQLAPGQEFGPGFVPAVAEVLKDPYITETKYQLGYIPKAAMVVHISRCRFDLR